MTLGEHSRVWALALLALIAALWLLGPILTPFLLGAAIAYLADPLADRLERLGLSRVAATIIVTVAALVIAVLALLGLIPLLIDQIRLAAEAAPRYIGALREFFDAHVAPRLAGEIESGSPLSTLLENVQSSLRDMSGRILETAWTSGLAVIEFVVLIVVTPVVAFYLLIDWDRMIARIDDLLPRDRAETIRDLARQSDAALAGFLRGQGTVCLILGAFYATALMIVGLPFGLLIGLFAGLISFIPYIGAVLGGLLSVGVATFHFWNDPVWIAVVAAIFLFGQAIEGNVLTPNLVGGNIGLHPVWLMFALSAFGLLMGFTGFLIAVPAAAVIGVLVRFAAAQYKASGLYRSGGGG